jgi:cytochrome c biogenesis protein CcdA
MKEVLVLITPIALLDSLSIVPVCVVPMISLLASKRPYAGAFAFILGIFVAYMVFGLLIFFGLDGVFNAIREYFGHKWNHPDTHDFVFEIALGVVMVAFGYRLVNTRRGRTEKKRAQYDDLLTPGAAFSAAAMLVIVGLPGAIPFFAAADIMLRADLPSLATALALLFYNVIFVVPILGIVVMRVLFPKEAANIFEQVNAWLERWGKRMAITALLILGTAMIVDGATAITGNIMLLSE